MSDQKEDGGCAFPLAEAGGHGMLVASSYGMSLRDYFAAHAPAEPHTWFSPAIPDRPKHPDKYIELTENQRREYEHLDEFAFDAGSAEVREFCKKVSTWCEDDTQWQLLEIRERYLQWPFAWADAMLKARKS